MVRRSLTDEEQRAVDVISDALLNFTMEQAEIIFKYVQFELKQRAVIGERSDNYGGYQSADSGLD